jgi:steroid delta-isomerase
LVKGATMDTDHPAAKVALAAMSAVGAGDRDAWLACYTEDAVLHDPVGGSPLDPQGAGLRGRTALQRFWDVAVAPNDMHFTVTSVHPAGTEAAIVATVSIRLPDHTVLDYDGVFVYRPDDSGRIASMLGYWDVRSVMAGRTA